MVMEIRRMTNNRYIVMEGLLMNFIFISPHFPINYWRFCRQLKKNGVNVLGIGDSAYDTLAYSLKDTLTEYYRVDSLDNYDQMVRAVAYFTFKYGKIDWLESNNEHWMLQDARLRTDFHITTGCDFDQMKEWQSKIKMKEYYSKACIPAVPCHQVNDRDSCIAFMKKYSYPFIVKPERGSGAKKIWKLKTEAEFDYFYETRPKDEVFIAEPFVNGTVCAYDAIVDSKGTPIFESGIVMPTSILECINDKKDICFYVEKQISEDVKAAGRQCVKEFNVKSRFVHMEFLRLKEDMAGIGKKGELVGLEANMRPCDGYMQDMLNYGNSTDVYQIWADMTVRDKNKVAQCPEQYYCIYIGRRDDKIYKHTHQEVLSRFRASITMSDRVLKVQSETMGDQMYIAKFDTKVQMDEFVDYVLK